jgi:hypothetical protein
LGLFNGAPKNEKITLEGNKESLNFGLPPNQAAIHKAGSIKHAASKLNPEYGPNYIIMNGPDV